ncbi:PspA/IM30 family protein [uncultured Erythrobacter sp.]|uniref:PspA/IM30 family protein n=1 Tax=uncultured Erythrobacter sp. TaxID=263913 RepID=UPI00261D1422|nr:PspA/IM30 family protein [uncultured Erythrobacter sp.]
MLRAAIQLKDIVSSNVTALVESAANPSKLLHNLQREIEASIIALESDKRKAEQRLADLEARRYQTQFREADWGDQAKVAMDAGDEALARQALLAREDCRQLLDNTEQNLKTAKSELESISKAVEELNIKREDVRQRSADQLAADGSDGICGSSAHSKTDKRLDKISKLQRRAEFATDDVSPSISEVAVSRDIEEMRRERAVQEELDALRGGPAPKKSARRKSK